MTEALELRRVRLSVNGQPYEGDVEPRTTLVDFLRAGLGLTGTHVGCEHGVCGACTVLLDGRAVRSCIMLAVQADGAQLMTVEGLSHDGELHPVQQAFIDRHGLQCGFCTPGFLMSACELLSATPEPTDDDISDALGGNICRCTGYQSILEAVRLASERIRGTGGGNP
jgi:carbon-monoxide dehydrogenase small subunit